MHVVIVGAGPTGLFVALALARRGHRVSVVDRDPGPAPDGSWNRRGVMQFHQSHGYRGQVVDALRVEAPDVLDGLFAAGATLVTVPVGPPGLEATASLLCRRSVFDRVLWTVAQAQPGLRFVTGHADGLLSMRGRATGVLVDGITLDADLVIDASGRAGRALASVRGPAEMAECGVTYACREYALRPGAEPGPVNTPIGMMVGYPHYMAIVFRHDGPTFSVLLACAAADRPLRALREPEVFSAAERMIPHVAEWIDPARSRPIGPVRPGAGFNNSYRGQLDAAGAPALPGLIAVGDAVCTTTPLAGRGVALSLLQAHRLVDLVQTHPGDPAAVALALEDWCTAHIRPWFDDHLYTDADRVRRWAGGEIDLTRPLPSDLIAAAAEADPSLGAVIGPYEGMLTLPSSLDAIEPRVRELYAGGWRPKPFPGPTRDELVELCAAPSALAS